MVCFCFSFLFLHLLPIFYIRRLVRYAGRHYGRVLALPRGSALSDPPGGTPRTRISCFGGPQGPQEIYYTASGPGAGFYSRFLRPGRNFNYFINGMMAMYRTRSARAFSFTPTVAGKAPRARAKRAAPLESQRQFRHRVENSSAILSYLFRKAFFWRILCFLSI